MATVIEIPEVIERDIDFLLLEEFVASPDFGTWFLARPGIDQTAGHVIEAGRSVMTENGESDLQLTFLDNPKPLRSPVEIIDPEMEIV